MIESGDLFGHAFLPIAKNSDPVECHVAAADLHRSGRRAGQCAAILARLQEGPATNTELAEIALRYGGRIYDLRAEGWRIKVTRQHENGVTVYALEGK